MTSIYNFNLTNGTSLTTVRALEGNGTGNQSVPRQILDISFDSSTPHITVADDVTARFINGFSFDIIGSSPYDGTYTVSGAPTVETLLDGKIVTHIPLATPPTVTGYIIKDVVTGVSGSWVIAGPSNGNIQFYPTSVFTVSGNSLPAANGTYTIASSNTGTQFSVSSVVTGLSGRFIITGDHTKFFSPTATFNAVNTGGYDQIYPIASVALVTGNTEVTVTGTIPVGTTINVNTILKLTTPNTVIVISGTVPAGAGTNGTAIPAAPIIVDFAKSTPILITPTTPHNYLVTFKVRGDQHLKFTTQTSFFPHNVLYNGTPYANAFVVQSSSYTALTDTTNIIVAIVDDHVATPVITISDTHGYQIVNFSALTAGTDATNLVALTTYTATITVDGVAKPISILGSTAATFADLILALDTQLGGDALATLDIPNKQIHITSTSTGTLSTIAITPDTLFAAPLANFTTISTAVTGTNLSWLVFPVPAVPYGFIRYVVTPVSTSLQLVGPGSPGFNSTTTWGQSFQNNVIHLTENFANTTAPVSPLVGQLWYNPTIPNLSVYEITPTVGWNSIVSIIWPVQGYIDMNNHPIARLTDAVTTYPYVASLTGVGNNDQEALNLRTGDDLYIAKTGGSSATASVRSGTMTGSLNMNGVSPGGASAIGINVNSAPISMYSSSDLLFKTGGTGNLTFEATTTGNITILGSGNVVVTNGNVTVGSGTEKVVIQNNPGLAPTITFTTATTNNAVINLANNKIVNLYTPTDALDAANKAYVDSLVNGIIWIQPVKDPNLFDDSLSAPPTITPGDSTIAYHKTYIVKSPGSGLWVGLDNRAVVYDPQQTAWIDILGRNVQVGDRFGVFCEPYENDPLVSLPAGGLLNKAGKIVTIATTTPSLTYTDYTPIEPDAFSVTGANPTINALTNSYDRSPHFGHSYTFRGTWGTGAFGVGYKWIEFSGPQMLVDGAGLQYTGNILNVGTGFGITVNADTVQVNQTDLNGVYLRRDGTLPMLGNLDLNTTYKIINLASPTNPNDAVNKTFADTTYVALAGSNMNTTANITFSGGGEILGLPATPTVGGAATSKTYVDNQLALKLALAGGSMNTAANITLSGGGEILGLPATPSVGGAATSRTYVDAQLALKPNDTLVVHLAGTETITGAKTFTSTVDISGAVSITGGVNITLSGGTGELLGLPATPSGNTAATSKLYVDTQLVPKATDTLVVHLAGIEIITGAKTFSAATVINNSLIVAANGSFTNLSATTTGFSVLGTAVGAGGAYTVSLTAGQNTAGVGGLSSLIGSWFNNWWSN